MEDFEIDKKKRLLCILSSAYFWITLLSGDYTLRGAIL